MQLNFFLERHNGNMLTDECSSCFILQKVKSDFGTYVLNLYYQDVGRLPSKSSNNR